MTLGRTPRMLLLYGTLVAPPLAGLFAILHLGEGLTAPHSIGGTWTATLDGSDSCTEASLTHSLEMTVSQSGPRAEVTFSTVYPSLSIDIDGDQFSGAKRGAPGGCRDIAIEAQIGPHAVIDGTVGHPSCRECPIVHFHAERKAARAQRGSKRP